MNSLASSPFFENFHTPRPRMGGAECVPAGPAGLLWWLMSSAIGIFSLRAALYGLIGLWIHEPFPDRMKRLFPASSQDRTSGSIASLNNSLYHSMTFSVLSELIPGVFPSASSTFAPYDQATDQYVEWASEQWLMGIPTGLPCFFSTFPCLRSSSHVFGGCSKSDFLKCAWLYVPGNETQNHGTPFRPDFVWFISAANGYQPPICLPSLSTTSSRLASRLS